jgi:hypothetical protein
MKDGMPLDQALRSAYAPEQGCPPPEVWLSREAADLPMEERHRLAEHAEHCPACVAERELARRFEAPPEEVARRREDVDALVARLESAFREGPGRPAAKVIPIAEGRQRRHSREPRQPTAYPVPETAPEAAPGALPEAERAERRRPGLRPVLGLLAAAMLALAFAALLELRTTAAPPLPAPAGPGVVRGAELAAVSPRGDLAAIPRELRWEEIAGASRYRWRLISVDGTILREETASGSPVPVPPDLARALQPAVLYTWTIEALDDQGRRIAVSEPVRFRVRPVGEEVERERNSVPPSAEGGGRTSR